MGLPLALAMFDPAIEGPRVSVSIGIRHLHLPAALPSPPVACETIALRIGVGSLSVHHVVQEVSRECGPIEEGEAALALTPNVVNIEFHSLSLAMVCVARQNMQLRALVNYVHLATGRQRETPKAAHLHLQYGAFHWDRHEGVGASDFSGPNDIVVDINTESGRGAGRTLNHWWNIRHFLGDPEVALIRALVAILATRVASTCPEARCMVDEDRVGVRPTADRDLMDLDSRLDEVLHDVRREDRTLAPQGTRDIRSPGVAITRLGDLKTMLMMTVMTMLTMLTMLTMHNDDDDDDDAEDVEDDDDAEDVEDDDVDDD